MYVYIYKYRVIICLDILLSIELLPLLLLNNSNLYYNCYLSLLPHVYSQS